MLGELANVEVGGFAVGAVLSELGEGVGEEGGVAVGAGGVFAETHELEEAGELGFCYAVETAEGVEHISGGLFVKEVYKI